MASTLSRPVRLVLLLAAASMTMMVPMRAVSSAERVHPPIVFGAYVPPAPESGMEAVHELERAIDHNLGAISFYQAWGGDYAALNLDAIEAASDGGRKVLLTWEPWVPGAGPDQPDFSLAQILSGRYDGYIRTWAEGLADLESPLFLRPLHEMNGNWYPWGGKVNGNTSAQYRKTWRKLHRMFASAGADQVRWVWSPYVDDVPSDNRLEDFYPGDRYVDVIALDGYNWGTSEPGYGGWRSFEDLFRSAYRRVKALGDQPIWIGETASAPEGGDKAQWIRDMGRALEEGFPRIKVVVWFNVDKERDWTLTSQAEVRQATKEILPLRGDD